MKKILLILAIISCLSFSVSAQTAVNGRASNWDADHNWGFAAGIAYNDAQKLGLHLEGSYRHKGWEMGAEAHISYGKTADLERSIELPDGNFQKILETGTVAQSFDRSYMGLFASYGFGKKVIFAPRIGVGAAVQLSGCELHETSLGGKFMVATYAINPAAKAGAELSFRIMNHHRLAIGADAVYYYKEAKEAGKSGWGFQARVAWKFRVY